MIASVVQLHSDDAALLSCTNSSGAIACRCIADENLMFTNTHSICMCDVLLCQLLTDDAQVGVSDVCVMGLNENHGQTIRLRLRTDDLQGFRKSLSIKKVYLIHIL